MHTIDANIHTRTLTKGIQKHTIMHTCALPIVSPSPLSVDIPSVPYLLFPFAFCSCLIRVTLILPSRVVLRTPPSCSLMLPRLQPSPQPACSHAWMHWHRFVASDMFSYTGRDGAEITARTLRGTLYNELPQSLAARLCDTLMASEATVCTVQPDVVNT